MDEQPSIESALEALEELDKIRTKLAR